MKIAKIPAGLVFLLILPALCAFLSCQSLSRSKKQTGIPDKFAVFTFDDGPNSQGDTTARLLDILKKYQIQAMFALLGENAEYSPDLVRRIRDEGHYIINHGYYDTWAVNMGREFFLLNLEMGEQAISAALGEPLNPRLYRPQGGFYKKRHLKIWQSQGYTLIPSTARSYDAVKTAAGADRVVRAIMRKVEKQKGGIIMLHDGRDSHRNMEMVLKENPYGSYNRSWIPETVERLILTLQEEGYALSGFDALEAVKYDPDKRRPETRPVLKNKRKGDRNAP
ncbi:MAG: polysaccharide deacetylase family protein [Treponema sp.]|jgi:peptidoglycan/xylan/chitin deacetylase (PgdA/CDA1 family)|nr:polysaccharide deacetylase family protein [Treponema sp.]